MLQDCNVLLRKTSKPRKSPEGHFNRVASEGRRRRLQWFILKLCGEAAALCDAVGVVIVVRCLNWTGTWVRGGSGRWNDGRECGAVFAQTYQSMRSYCAVRPEHICRCQAFSGRFKSSVSLRRSVCISRPLGACSALLKMQRFTLSIIAASRRVTLRARPAERLPISFNKFPK
jgi:hypothetical protein